MSEVEQLEKDLRMADIVNGKLVKKLEMVDNALQTWDDHRDTDALVLQLRSILDETQQSELVADEDVVEIDEAADP